MRNLPMPRPLILLIAFSLFTATVYGQEGKAPSPAVKRILDEAVRDIRVNRQAFDKANQKPLGEARKALEELSTKLIKDGKADEAAAVLRQVGTLEADVMKMANAPAPVAGGGAVPQKPLLERLAGKWDTQSTLFLVIDPDGATRSVAKDTGQETQRSRVEVRGENAFVVRWGNGWSWDCTPAGDDAIAVFDTNPQGQRNGTTFVLSRVK